MLQAVKRQVSLEILLIPYCALASSCIQGFDPSGADSCVVVECVLTDSSFQTLSVYYTKDGAQDVADMIENAECMLSDITIGDAPVYFSFSNGRYTLLYSPLEGHRYKLFIKMDGGKTIEAETTFPHKAYLSYNSKTFNGSSPYWTHFAISKGTEDATWIFYSGSEDSYLATTYPYVDDFNETDSHVSQFYSLTDGWLGMLLHGAYALAFQGSQNDGDSFIVPDSDAAKRVAENFLAKYLHKNSLRVSLSENVENGQIYPSFTIVACLRENDGTQISSKENEMMKNNALRFYSVSDEYDRYLIDMAKEKPSGWNNMFYRSNPYSNISGATGIFGAAVPCSLTPVEHWFVMNPNQPLY